MKQTRVLGLLIGACFLTCALNAADVKVVTRRDSSLPAQTVPNGNSFSPVLTPDGRFLAFTSDAGNLVTNDNLLLSTDVFVRDRESHETRLVSVNQFGTGGGNGHSAAIAISTNGQFVLLESGASDLVPGTSKFYSYGFVVRNLSAGTTDEVNPITNRIPTSVERYDPVMTPDGRYVAFISTDVIVPGDANRIPDLFVRDMVSRTTVIASIGATGAYSVVTSPAITPDGRLVAFFSTAKGMVPNVPTYSKGEIYLRDLVTATTYWPSSNAFALMQASASSVPVPSHPVISADGRYVAYKIGWTNTAATTNCTWIMRYDVANDVTAIVSTNGYPLPVFDPDDNYGPEMSPDGRFVVFVGREIAGDSLGSSIQLWDEQTGTNVLVSGNASGAVPEGSVAYAPRLSSDGRFVCFMNNASNLVTNPVVPGSHIYFRDLQSAGPVLVDADTNGVGIADVALTVPSMSADGAVVSYCGPDADLVGLPADGYQDVFLWHADGGTNELISRPVPSLIQQTPSSFGTLGQVSFSDDGGRLVYASTSPELISSDTNQQGDIFLWDTVAGVNTLLSVDPNGRAALGGFSHTPTISGNGRFVSFTSSATNLVAQDTNGVSDVFVRDLENNTTSLQSVDSAGAVVSKAGASWAALSWDGRYLAFIAKPNSTTSGVYWRDTVLGVTRQITTYTINDTPLVEPRISISANGQRVAYQNASKNLYVWDAATQANIYANTATTISSAALSPAGDRLLFHNLTTLSSGTLICYDLIGGSNLVSFATNLRISNFSPWSQDGRFFTFVSTNNLLGGGVHGTRDVYLYDLQTRTLTLVSANRNGTGVGNNHSDLPVISGNGRCIAYRSTATDLVAETIYPPGIFVFDRLTGVTRSILSQSPWPNWLNWALGPTINASGDVVAFQSSGPLIAQGDLNRIPDLFAGSTGLPSTQDSDADGIPDWWMQQYFQHSTGQVGDQSRAADDADGDGQTNYQEYISGTVPTDGTSVFALQVLPASRPVTQLTLNWPAVPGRTYQVQYATNLSAAVWRPETSAAQVIGNRGSATVAASSSIRFYRVLCSLGF